MGFMGKMRDNTGVVLWILVVAFGLIFMLQDTNVFDIIGRTGNAIAKVNGEEISLDEYNTVVQGQIQRIRQNANEEIPPQTEDLIRDQVFDQLVDDRLRQQEMDRMGVTVTASEIQYMVFGANPHPAIADYFRGSDGEIDRELLSNFAENQDNTEWWVGVERFLEAERRREKLDNLLAATVRISDEQIRDYYRRQNLSVSADYVALRYVAVPDDQITVTERDLQAYYDDHRSEFERKQSHILEYVERSKDPTAADTAAILQDLDRIVERFRETDQDSVFLARHYSDRQYNNVSFRRDELHDSIAVRVFEDLTVGRIVGPIAADGLMHLVKITGVEPAGETSVKARHILKRAPEGDDEARATARQSILDIRSRIQRGESFADLARAESDDIASGSQGGELGWFGPGSMVAPFEEAAFGARPGALVGPVETQFGYHLIEVLDTSTQAVRVADMAHRIRSSPGTLSQIEDDLGDLRFFAEEEGDFRSEAERRSLEIQTVQIEDEQQFIPNIGNSRALENFLADASVGDISDPIELNDKYILAILVETRRAGTRPFQEVRDEIEPRVRTEARKEHQVSTMRDALSSAGSDLSALAEAAGSSVQSASGVTIANPVVPGYGREPAFVGTAAGLDDGELSKVVAGNSAAFVIRKVSGGVESEMTAADRERIRNQLLQQRRNQLRTQWIAELRGRADIVDNRRVFLR